MTVTPGHKTSVLVCSEEPVLAAGAAEVINETPAMHVSELRNGLQDLRQRPPAAPPDILLLDVGPDVTLGIVGELRESLPGTKLVLWLRQISLESGWQAIEQGARGILGRTARPERMMECLKSVAAGEVRCDLTLRAGPNQRPRIALSGREGQLVSLLCQGLKNKEIAYALSVTEGTVKTYLSRLFQKTGAKDRFELALFGLKSAADSGSMLVDSGDQL